MKISSICFFVITLLMGMVSAKITIDITDDQIVIIIVPRNKEKIAFTEINDIINSNEHTYKNKEKFSHIKEEFNKLKNKDRFHTPYVHLHPDTGDMDKASISAYLSPDLVNKIKSLPYVLSIKKDNLISRINDIHEERNKKEPISKPNTPKITTIAKAKISTTTITKTKIVNTTSTVKSNSPNTTPVNQANTKTNTNAKTDAKTDVKTNTTTDIATTTTTATVPTTNDINTTSGTIVNNGTINTNSTNLTKVTSPQQKPLNNQQTSGALTNSILRMVNLLFISVLTVTFLF
ncbi:hypothetical protein PIROE2DRAFT_16223 [Piromyces sp. E2]|nr:hypothetical protein PIROE2DRAFT_16223 [Piromyces sp. E2]|eukprot:OUM58481.1 hypothetical protein PIROE2DRAFT_16223 [Piromyces sp. E2]